MDVLVTGDTGFLGAALAHRLIAPRFDDVRVLDRPASNWRTLEGLSVAIVVRGGGKPFATFDDIFELEYKHPPTRQAVADAVEWTREHGYLR